MEKINYAEEVKKKNPICAICGKECETEWGNNPYPVVKDRDAVCCDTCNIRYVIPKRVEELNEEIGE